MPVNAKHPSYRTWAPIWGKTRLMASGAVFVKAKALDYIPKLTKQLEPEYRAMINRAWFAGRTKLTLKRLIGAFTRKPIIFDLPPMMQKAGEAITRAYPSILESFFLTGGFTLLWDFPEVGGNPRLIVFPSESIINWAPDGTWFIAQGSRLRQDPLDKFEIKEEEQFTEYALDDRGYVIRSWVKRPPTNTVSKEEYLVESEKRPSFGESTLNFIPFVRVHSPDAPLADMADTNLAHFMSQVDLGHGAHWAGLPTLFGSGLATVGELPEVSVGPTQIVHGQMGSDLKWVEISGAALSVLERISETHMQHMDEQSGMLSARRKGIESEGTARINISGYESVLHFYAEQVEYAIRLSVEKLALWMNEKVTDESVVVNRDFVNSSDVAKGVELVADLRDRPEPLITRRDALRNLQAMDVIRADISVDAYLVELDSER